jgi:hypothetical protein
MLRRKQGEWLGQTLQRCLRSVQKCRWRDLDFCVSGTAILRRIAGQSHLLGIVDELRIRE